MTITQSAGFELELIIDGASLSITNNIDSDCVGYDNSGKVENRTGTDITVTAESKHICCRGDSSCQGARKIELEDNSQNILCSGYESCANVNISIFASTDYNNVLCTGSFSCADVNKIQVDGYIYCAGAKSCQHTAFYQATTVYCTGMWS